MKEITVVLLGAVLFLLGFLWVTATMQSYGWKGLFVECRIMDCPK